MIVLLAALACAGTWAAGQVSGARDRSEVEKIMKKKSTVCMGRFLVDVPGDAQLRFLHEMMDGFRIETIEDGEAVFGKRLVACEAEIEARGTGTDSRRSSRIADARDLPRPGGQPADASLHGEAVLALWDSVSSSIRLRSVASTDRHSSANTPAMCDPDPT